MAKSPYEEKILEELRCLHAKEAMLYDILKSVKEARKEKKDGNSSTSNR